MKIYKSYNTFDIKYLANCIFLITLNSWNNYI